jgi:hypothetical protein
MPACGFPFGFDLHLGDEFHGMCKRFQALVDVDVVLLSLLLKTARPSLQVC